MRMAQHHHLRGRRRWYRWIFHSNYCMNIAAATTVFCAMTSLAREREHFCLHLMNFTHDSLAIFTTKAAMWFSSLWQVRAQSWNSKASLDVFFLLFHREIMSADDRRANLRHSTMFHAQYSKHSKIPLPTLNSHLHRRRKSLQKLHASNRYSLVKFYGFLWNSQVICDLGVICIRFSNWWP